MKRKLLVALALVMLFTLSFGLYACSGGGETEKIERETIEEVTDVKIVYDGKKVTSGVISVDLSKKGFTLTADVKKAGNPTYKLVFAGNNDTVATVSEAGEVSLKKEGEVVVTATAGEKSHSIALVVKNEFAANQKFAVTVSGGKTDKATAAAGERVRLSVDLDELAAAHKEFVEWNYFNAETEKKITDLWINGNEFEMPDYPILITAVLKDKLYELNAVDGTLKTAKKDGVDVAVEPQTDGSTTTYLLPYGTEVTLERRAEKTNEVFVGWDLASRKNRKLGAEVGTYTFEMPDETYAVFCCFSQKRALEFGSVGFGNSRDRITNGVVGGSADVDLEGLSGYTFTFKGNAGMTASEGTYSDNFTSTQNFSTLRYGSQTVKIIYKNHSERDLTLEFYATSYSAYATTGLVTVPAGETKKVYMIASSGYHNPNFGLLLRQPVGGSSSEEIKLDVVYVSADTYPDGDPQFAVADAQYVSLEKTTNGDDYPAGTGIRGDCWTPIGPVGVSFGGRKNVNNSNGITNLVSREAYISYSGTPYIYAKINNLPAYDASNPYVSVYMRVINNNSYQGKFTFCLGKTTNATTEAGAAKKEITLNANDVITLGLIIPRAQADNVYVSIIKSGKALSAMQDFNLVIQMMYNNKLNVEAQDVVRA